MKKNDFPAIKEEKCVIILACCNTSANHKLKIALVCNPKKNLMSSKI
jgi:hypothetical protein